MKHLYMPYLCIALILSPLQPILCSKWQLPRLFSEVILFHAKTFGSSAVGLTGEGGSNWNIFKKVEIKSFGQNQNQNSRLWGPWRFVVFLFEPPNPAPDRRPAGDPDLSQNMSSKNYQMFTMWMYRIFWMYRMFTMLLCGCTECLLCGWGTTRKENNGSEKTFMWTGEWCGFIPFAMIPLNHIDLISNSIRSLFPDLFTW